MIIRTRAYTRAGLVGNPSDGYFGKTIAFTFKNFCAEVTLFESPEIEIQPNLRDESRFSSIQDLVSNVRTFGYYGGIRLLKAAIKRFYDYCHEKGLTLDTRNFTLRYTSNIPHLVGLAGSSAIVTATLRALCNFYGVVISPPVSANLVLAVEKEELKISAGLQDRVVQAYEGLVYMDFDRKIMQRDGHGHYEPMDASLLPPIYIAYDATMAEVSDVFHNNIRERFERGEPQVLDAMRFWADLTDQVRDLLLKGEGRRIGPLLNANFDKRREIYRIAPRNIAIVEAARSVGASAKFSGSGGAIVGAYDDEAMFLRLQQVLEPMNVRVLKPILT